MELSFDVEVEDWLEIIAPSCYYSGAEEDLIEPGVRADLFWNQETNTLPDLVNSDQTSNRCVKTMI